jgi:prepilin-type N-terminal cleavage/methylation domain-containing protein
MQKTLFSTYCRKGLTLIEIMIVVALIATMMTIGAIGLGVLGQSDVQGEALRLSSLVRYTFTTAATSNATLQMKLNFDDSTFTVEKLELAGGLSDDELRGVTMKSVMSKSDLGDRQKTDDRGSRLDEEDSRFGSVQRLPLEDMFFDEEDTILQDGVYFIGLMTSHHDEIQREGVGTINFFANGFVERSVIFLGDEAARDGLEEGVVYAISVSPLTGQSSVVPGRELMDSISSTFFEEEEDR